MRKYCNIPAKLVNGRWDLLASNSVLVAIDGGFVAADETAKGDVALLSGLDGQGGWC